MNNRKYQLIVFDWDGTIIDSQAHIIQSMQRAIAEEALHMPTTDEIRHIIGLSLNGAIATLFPGADGATVERVAQHYREHFFSAGEQPSELFDHAADTIQDLHARGYYLAVATGKGRQGLDIALRTTGLRRFFHITRCADETRSKPDPMMLDEILTDLDLSAGDAIMVGDTSYDLDMASNIGMDSVAVSYGMHDVELLQSRNPTYLIHSIDQISQHV
jgi:phosphoglycolate phosphatase